MYHKMKNKTRRSLEIYTLRKPKHFIKYNKIQREES